MGNLSIIFDFFKEIIVLKSYLIKFNNRVLREKLDSNCALVLHLIMAPLFKEPKCVHTSMSILCHQISMVPPHLSLSLLTLPSSTYVKLTGHVIQCNFGENKKDPTWVASIQGHFRNILGAFQEHFRNILGTFQEHFRNILGTFQEHFRNILETFQKHFRNILGTFQEHFRNILGTFQEHFFCYKNDNNPTDLFY